MGAEPLPRSAQMQADGASALASRAMDSAVPFGDGDVAFASQAAEAGDAVCDVPGQSLFGHQAGNGLERAGGAAHRSLRAGRAAFASMARAHADACVAMLAQYSMMLSEDEGTSAFLDGVSVALDDLIDRLARRNCDFGQQGACGQPHQVVRVGDSRRPRRNR